MGLIRTLLALAVANFHAYNLTFASNVLELSWVNGEIAVETFFVISGFYMALILSGKYAGKSTWSFYRSRMLRLFPGYWLACIVTIVVLTATRQTRLFDYWQSLVI